MSTFRPGDVIAGRFRLLRSLGEGGFGAVFLADDSAIDRRVAIKFLLSDVAAEIGVREARAAGRVVHPNVVTIYDVGEFEGRVFIEMEYVDGRPLSEFMTPERLTLDERLRLIVQLGHGLHAAHQAAVIHRDIKPRNLIVDQNLLLKIVDFGIARASGTGTIVGTGQIAGSLDYMAPEQLESQEIDVRTDIFGATVVAYELLSCRRAYQGGLTTALRRVKNTSVQPLPDRIGPLAKSLDVAIKTGLARERRHRFATAQKFADTFEAIRAQAESEDTVRVSVAVPPVLAELSELSRLAEMEAEEPSPIAPTFGGQTTEVDGLPSSRRKMMVGIAAGIAVVIVIIALNGRQSKAPAVAIDGSEASAPVVNAAATPAPTPPQVQPVRLRPARPPADAASPTQLRSVTDASKINEASETARPPSGPATDDASTAGPPSSPVADPPAPATSPAPRPAVTRDPSPVLEIVQAYARSHQQRSAAGLKRLQPSLTTAQLSALDRSFAENESYDFRVSNISVVFNGDRAQVSCTIARTLSAGGQTRTVSRPGRFELAQDPGGQWLVTEFRIQP